MSRVPENYRVALPEAYALKCARREVHRDAMRLGARAPHRMARKAGTDFCVFSFSSERHMNAFMRRHGGKLFGADGWEPIIVR
ncbi:MAG: hypothetical protein J0H18_11265 [Rhizobiales bacterium]|nr:hypothetical protein [Hyphomicrobiales bacterium]OJY06703.1 MAG: hypothetical protein BGP07_16830 [Rhizobiales bacterium 63-22]